MKSVIFALLSLGVIASASPINSFSALEKFLSTRTSTRDAQSDLDTITAFLVSCPDGLLHSGICLIDNNYKEPATPAEECAMARLTLECMDRAITAYTSSCAGAAEASAAVVRLRPQVEAECEALNNSSAASLVAGLFAVIIMTSVHLLH